MRFVLAALATVHVLAGVVTVRNDVPRVDEEGHIVNAHDGSVVFFDGVSFMYGTVRTPHQLPPPPSPSLS